MTYISARAMLSDVEDIPWPSAILQQGDSSQGGPLRLQRGDDAAEQRVGELLSLIAARREFQMA